MMNANERRGGCLCGGVRYAVSGRPRDIVVCHCGQCRRQTGSALFASAAPREHFRLIAEGPLRWFEASPQARRGFCSHCGSVLFWDGHGLDYIALAAGSLDDAGDLTVIRHIFLADKPAWGIAPSGVPHFPADAT